MTVSGDALTTLWRTKPPEGTQPGIHPGEWGCDVLHARQCEGKEKEGGLVPGQWESARGTDPRKKNCVTASRARNGETLEQAGTTGVKERS